MNLTTLFTTLLLSIVNPQSLALVEQSIDAETQLKSWALTQGTFSFELIQRLPDQTRAFFQARGFAKKIANDIGTQCVLQAIGRNTSVDNTGSPISFDLQEWIIQSETQSRSIKLKEDWDAQWPDDLVSSAARIAFRWATFPTEQTFEPAGDYNWGMISFGLPPGSLFDLKVVWRQNNEIQYQWIKQIECPADR